MNRPLVEDTWRHRLRERYRDPHTRPWLRVTAYTEVHATEHGHVPLTPGSLGRALGLTQQQVSRAIATAIDNRLLDPASSARCLVLPGHAGAPCPATHRGDR